MQFVINGWTQAFVGLVVASIFYLFHVGAAAVRKQERDSWRAWLGLNWPSNPGNSLKYFVFFVAFGTVFAMAMRFFVTSGTALAEQSPQHQIALLPTLVMIPAALTYALVTTGFTEELIFRGVIAKRCFAWFGFDVGNWIQAAIFGALHILIVWVGVPDPGLLMYLLAAGFPTALGWYAGYAMENHGEGSILIPWMMHAGANLGTVLAYLIAPVA